MLHHKENCQSLTYLEQIKQHGFSVFLMPSQMLGTFLSLSDVLPMFSNSGWGQKANIAFLKKHMGAWFKRRAQPWIANLKSGRCLLRGFFSSVKYVVVEVDSRHWKNVSQVHLLTQLFA
ncbi:hypothetical protein HPP92_017085 [Vanilla planifolia]|uniref:Uncharacterized protein n=1 Tax=Vanilla planifolia TaxID=51239 RepID=A0A835QH08_VANPL|nr:hypothetical protein HPP92_017085 [Vanilla planifolia]